MTMSACSYFVVVIIFHAMVLLNQNMKTFFFFFSFFLGGGGYLTISFRVPYYQLFNNHLFKRNKSNETVFQEFSVRVNL